MCSDRHLVRGTIEEANAQIVFQRFDLERDRGLGKEEVLRGFAEVQVLSDGTKDLEAKVFELGHERLPAMPLG